MSPSTSVWVQAQKQWMLNLAALLVWDSQKQLNSNGYFGANIKGRVLQIMWNLTFELTMLATVINWYFSAFVKVNSALLFRSSDLDPSKNSEQGRNLRICIFNKLQSMFCKSKNCIMDVYKIAFISATW